MGADEYPPQSDSVKITEDTFKDQRRIILSPRDIFVFNVPGSVDKLRIIMSDINLVYQGN